MLLKLRNANWQKLQVIVAVNELMLQDDMADSLSIGSFNAQTTASVAVSQNGHTGCHAETASDSILPWVDPGVQA